MTRIWTRLCDQVLSVAAGDRSQLSAFQQGDADLAAQTRLFPARRTSSSCTHNARFEAHSHVRGTPRDRKGAGVRAQVRHSAPRWPHAGCESQSRVGPQPAALGKILHVHSDLLVVQLENGNALPVHKLRWRLCCHHCKGAGAHPQHHRLGA